MNLIEWPYYRAEFLLSQGFSESFLKWFWSRVEITPTCHLWTGTIAKNGYGVISLSSPRVVWQFAHRVAFLIKSGSLPDEVVVMHKCDVRRCVRFDHLEAGTLRLNNEDMVGKKRHCHGERRPNHLLSEHDVLEIREFFNPNRDSLAWWAKTYGVTKHAIFDVVHGRSWRHLLH